MSGEKFGESNRREFLKGIGAAAALGAGAGQVARIIENTEARTVYENPSKEEQVTPLTHYSEGVADALQRNRERILFDPATGALRIKNEHETVFSNDIGARPPQLQGVSVTLGKENYSLTFVYTLDNGGWEIEIKNVYGDPLEVEAGGWGADYSQK